MPTCRCEACSSTFDAIVGQQRTCPYCTKNLFVYRCGSCMKTYGLMYRRATPSCPACFTVIPSPVRATLGINSASILGYRPPPPPTPPSVLQQMYDSRGEYTMMLYRVCTPDEARETIRLKLAGGKEVQLARFKANSEEMQNQVGNSEGALVKNEVLLKQLEMLKSKGSQNLTSVPRTVIEFSPHAATQFVGNIIKVEVNGHFVIRGSKIEAENGYIIQIGTPLLSASMYRDTNHSSSSSSSMPSAAVRPPHFPSTTGTFSPATMGGGAQSSSSSSSSSAPQKAKPGPGPVSGSLRRKPVGVLPSISDSPE